VRLNEKKERPLSRSEKAVHNTGLYGVMIRHLGHSRLSHQIAMHMTVSLMVVDAQETLAVRKRAFPVIRRGF